MTTDFESASASPLLFPVLISEPLPEPVEQIFRNEFSTIQVLQNAKILYDKPEQSTVGINIIIATVNSILDKQFFMRIDDDVNIVGLYSSGHGHVNLEAARDRGITVINTPGVLSDSVADLALLLILGAARRVVEGIDLIRQRKWRGWSPSLLNGQELRGKTLGIFGMGRIGREIAKRARAFGMTIIYRNRSRLPPDQEIGALYMTNDREFLRTSQIVVLTAPSTPNTYKFLNAQRISELAPGSIIVNVARGDLVDDDALIQALRSGHIAAAGLDVFDREPDLDPRYAELPNVLPLPHLGSSTMDARIAMASSLAYGIKLVLRGKDPENRLT